MAHRSPAPFWLIVIGLSLGPAVSNGFARFAYGLVLPAMRDDLGWSYTEAGWINTANALGYLAGSLLAFGVISRLGPAFLFIGGMALTSLALVLCAMTQDFWLLTFWRVVAGIGGAPVFIAGGVMASALFPDDKAKNALAIAVYFGGGGIGMIITGAALPYLVDWYGVGVWPLTWLFVGVMSFLCFLPGYWSAAAAPPAPPQPAGGAGRLPNRAMLCAEAAYFCFGLGYVIYVTFLIAWLQGRGASAGLVAWTWVVMGLAVWLSPFIWRGVLARAEGGRAIALTSLAVGVGVVIPLIDASPIGVTLSALLMGGSFFMVPTSVTTFSRKNLPRAQWGRAVALFTVIFSIGQIIGPTGAGLLADMTGDNSLGLGVAGGVLLLGALLGAMQKPLPRP